MYEDRKMKSEIHVSRIQQMSWCKPNQDRLAPILNKIVKHLKWRKQVSYSLPNLI